MTLNELIKQVEEQSDPLITPDTPIHFIDLDCDGGDPELSIYRDDADRVIIRAL